MASPNDPRGLESGTASRGPSKEIARHPGRTAHNMSSSSLRKKSDISLVSRVRCGVLRNFLANLQEIFLGTKLFLLFPTVPLAVAANYYDCGKVSALLYPDYSFLYIYDWPVFETDNARCRVRLSNPHGRHGSSPWVCWVLLRWRSASVS